MIGIERDADGIPCPACKVGYAERVDCTEEECREHGCGRDRPGLECCARAFACLALRGTNRLRCAPA